MQKAFVQLLSRKDPLATHSSFLAWEIPWTGKPGGLQCMGFQRIEHS